MSFNRIFLGGRRSNVFNPFSTDVCDPFDGFSFDNELVNAPQFSSEAFIFGNDLVNPPNSASETFNFGNTRIDWKETPEAHIFKADLPGLKEEEVKVEVEDGRVLQISGERSREQEEKNVKWYLVERSSGKFHRSFWLPENANMDQIKANMENGVLTVVVPRVEKKKPEVKSIEISG